MSSLFLVIVPVLLTAMAAIIGALGGTVLNDASGRPTHKPNKKGWAVIGVALLAAGVGILVNAKNYAQQKAAAAAVQAVREQSVQQLHDAAWKMRVDLGSLALYGPNGRRWIQDSENQSDVGIVKSMNMLDVLPPLPGRTYSGWGTGVTRPVEYLKLHWDECRTRIERALNTGGSEIPKEVRDSAEALLSSDMALKWLNGSTDDVIHRFERESATNNLSHDGKPRAYLPWRSLEPLDDAIDKLLERAVVPTAASK